MIKFKRRRHPVKQPMDAGQVMTPLMSGFDMQNASMIAPSDPVEMRRMNFQTPGMLSHPPIPVSQLASHIEELKSEGAAKFTAEYESIEPGQQFTWDNSSMDINKPKNRSDSSQIEKFSLALSGLTSEGWLVWIMKWLKLYKVSLNLSR